MSRSIRARAIAVCAGLLVVITLGCSRSIPVEPQSVTLHNAAGTPQLAAAVHRPLSDFLSAQGSTNGFIPPLPDFIAWTNNNPQTMFVSVDYAGLVASYLTSHGGPSLGTQMSGSVLERPLADGRAEVSVILHTDRALTWTIALPSTDLAGDPLLYGYRGTDLVANPLLTPALSSSDLQVVFKNTAPGAALPDLVTAFILGEAEPGQELVMLAFRSRGSGPLRAAFGVADGTPGRCTVVNTGLFRTPFKGAVADAFPAEHVQLQVAGGGGGKGSLSGD
jgi:hypothetical protein